MQEVKPVKLPYRGKEYALSPAQHAALRRLVGSLLKRIVVN